MVSSTTTLRVLEFLRSYFSSSVRSTVCSPYHHFTEDAYDVDRYGEVIQYNSGNYVGQSSCGKSTLRVLIVTTTIHVSCIQMETLSIVDVYTGIPAELSPDFSFGGGVCFVFNSGIITGVVYTDSSGLSVDI